MTSLQDSKSLSKARYSQFAQGYVTSQTHGKGADLDRLIDIAQSQKDWKVLDVATGGGHTALKFAPYVNKVIATDLTPNMLDAAREHILSRGVENVNFKVADAENLPFEEGGFDLVTCRIAPHHFPNIAQFVKEATRVLKKGGLLLVQDHVLPDNKEAATIVNSFEKVRDPSHNVAFSHGAWVETFEDAGLTVEHTEQLTKRHPFLSWAERQGCTPQIIEQLLDMATNAPPLVTEWMAWENFGTPDISFVNHHIIIAGRKR